MTPTPETHVFIGMFRPPWHSILTDAKDRNRAMGYLICSGCEMEHYTENRAYTVMLRNCWQDGHFDTPQYATREEIIDRIAEKAHADSRT